MPINETEETIIFFFFVLFFKSLKTSHKACVPDVTVIKLSNLI